jgi:DNA-binding NarL/FixJ family response regulator
MIEMYSTSMDVLVIDDLEDFAATCAELIKLSCGVNVAYASTPLQAENIVKSNTVKVIIFDYHMPEINGIALYRRLRAIDNDFKAILLTIETGDAKILSNAQTIGFNYLMIKGSEDYLLQYRVLSLLNQYGSEKFSQVARTPFFSAKIGGIFSKHIINYYIQQNPVQSLEYEDEKSWVQSDELFAGEKKEISIEKEFITINELSSNLTFGADFDFDSQLGLPKACESKFCVKFLSTLQKTLTSNYKQSLKSAQKKTWSRELPRTGDIAYERYEYSPEYKKVRIFLMVEFSWTKKKTFECLEIVVPTGSCKRRIYRRYNNGHEEYINLPINKIPIEVENLP